MVVVVIEGDGEDVPGLGGRGPGGDGGQCCRAADRAVVYPPADGVADQAARAGVVDAPQHPVQDVALVSEPLSLLHGRYGLDGSALRPVGCGVERAERDLGPDPVALLAGGAGSGLGQCAEQGFDL